MFVCVSVLFSVCEVCLFVGCIVSCDRFLNFSIYILLKTAQQSSSQSFPINNKDVLNKYISICAFLNAVDKDV